MKSKCLDFMEIPKLDDPEIPRDEFDHVVEWMEFLDAKSKGVMEMLAEKNQDIKKAYDILQIISKDEKARMLYDAREAALRDELTRIETAENKGEAEGLLRSICRYLETRFGAESQALQETARTITNLDALSRIIDRIFVVSNLDEAMSLIRDNLVTQ